MTFILSTSLFSPPSLHHVSLGLKFHSLSGTHRMMLKFNLTLQDFHMQARFHLYKPKPSYSLYKHSSMARPVCPVNSIDRHCFAHSTVLLCSSPSRIYVIHKILSTLSVFLLLPKVFLITLACPTLPSSTCFVLFIAKRSPHYTLCHNTSSFIVCIKYVYLIYLIN